MLWPMCPRCRQNAPIVYRGVTAYCTACGASRMPLATQSVNMAGQTSKVGGTVARVFGWLVMGGGLLFSLLLALVLQLAIPEGYLGYIFGTLFGLPSAVVGFLLLRGGKSLTKSGEEKEKSTKGQALFALANLRGGVLTAVDAAGMLGVPTKEADDRLTALAKEHPDYVTVDVSDDGVVLYRFPNAHWNAMHYQAQQAWAAQQGRHEWWVANGQGQGQAAAAGGVRVGAETRVASDDARARAEAEEAAELEAELDRAAAQKGR